MPRGIEEEARGREDCKRGRGGGGWRSGRARAREAREPGSVGEAEGGTADGTRAGPLRAIRAFRAIRALRPFGALSPAPTSPTSPSTVPTTTLQHLRASSPPLEIQTIECVREHLAHQASFVGVLVRVALADALPGAAVIALVV